MPVMEGKACCSRSSRGVDALPICLDTQDVDEIVRTVPILAPTFGGINLEDICAPRCFEMEQRLRELLDIPVFHDDQHGTAVVVLRGAAQRAARGRQEAGRRARWRFAGAGAAGDAIAKLPSVDGVRATIVVCDRKGVHRPQPRRDGKGHDAGSPRTPIRATHRHAARRRCAAPTCSSASPAPTCSAARTSQAWPRSRSSSRWPIPIPEIDPEAARAYAAVVATGRSDYPNQINNVLAFPGVFRGMLDARAGRSPSR